MKLWKYIFNLMSLMIISSMAFAGEFRTIKPIPTPVMIPKGAKPTGVEEIAPQKATSYMKEILNSWNNKKLSQHIAPDFYNKSRLLDAMTDPNKVPPDAKIRLISIKSIQTLNQYERPLSNGAGKEIIRTLSVTADSQIELNDPSRGFRKLEGTNEYIIRVIEQEVEK